jgi:uncharacterized cofD-like protein
MANALLGTLQTWVHNGDKPDSFSHRAGQKVRFLLGLLFSLHSNNSDKLNPVKKSELNIVVIGGGTGSFTLLSALKNHTPNITALVNMADDGGSTGVLIDELGVLPPGDVRQCLVALSNAPEVRDLFNYRFPRGMLHGHSFGNLFLSAVEKMTSNFNDAIRMAGDVLQIQGRVVPITLDKCELVCAFGKKKVKGQRKIELTTLPKGTRPSMYFKKPARLNPEAQKSILQADLVIIAPGNLYASLAPALIVQGVPQALAKTKAKVAYVCNLVNKPNHTCDFAVHDYAEEIERFTGKNVLDYILFNVDMPSNQVLQRYALDKEFPVAIDEAELKKAHYKTVAGRFLSHEHHKRDRNDSFIKRSLIRHDGEAVAEALLKLL